jgi:TrmH family RNA methyltransferase
MIERAGEGKDSLSSDPISSKNNARIKAIRRLRSRQERDRTGSFLVEGIRQVSEAIQSRAEITELVVAFDLLRSQFALDEVETQEQLGTSILRVTGDVFASISERDHPQGLAAVVRQPSCRLSDIIPSPDALWVALESVADPGNLGTILRTADAVGASGVILLGRSTDPFDPAAVRASMGAVFTQQIVHTSGPELLRWVKDRRIRIAGTSPSASLDYHEADYPSPLVLLMGSERHGLPEELLRACNPLVRLPMAGRVDSLNLAVATGVMLYEIFNQRRSPKSSGRGRSRSSRRVSNSNRANRQ